MWKNMSWTKCSYFIHSGRRHILKSPYRQYFTFWEQNECYCSFWLFNILFLLWLVPTTVTHVLFASWTLVASPSSTLCALGWDITATSFQPLLQTCYRKCTPLFYFCQRYQMTPLVSIRPVFFNGAQDHTGKKCEHSNSSFQHDSVKNLVFQSFSLPPVFFLHRVYTRR